MLIDIPEGDVKFLSDAGNGDVLLGLSRIIKFSCVVSDAQKVHTPYGSITKAAHDFLRDVLSMGAKLQATYLLSEAAKRGISRATLLRAKKTLGVKSEKFGELGGGHWRWKFESLPKR